MGFDIGDADVEALGNLRIGHLIDADREKHPAVHAVHPIDDALGAPKAHISPRPFFPFKASGEATETVKRRVKNVLLRWLRK